MTAKTDMGYRVSFFALKAGINPIKIRNWAAASKISELIFLFVGETTQKSQISLVRSPQNQKDRRKKP